MDICVVSTFWLSWIVLLWTQVWKSLCESLLLIIRAVYPVVESLDHTVILCLIFWGTVIRFSAAAAPFYTPNALSSSDFFTFSLSSPVMIRFSCSCQQLQNSSSSVTLSKTLKPRWPFVTIGVDLESKLGKADTIWSLLYVESKKKKKKKKTPKTKNCWKKTSRGYQRQRVGSGGNWARRLKDMNVQL